MINIPLVVPIKVLQQYAASQKLPFATLADKVKTQSNYINYQSPKN